MNKRFGIIVALCLVLAAIGYARNSQALGEEALYGKGQKELRVRFEQAAISLYAAASEGNRQAGYQAAERLDRLMRDARLTAYGTPDGWRSVRESLSAVKHSLESGQPGSSWYAPAARIRLVADVLVRPGRPLWQQYEPVMRDDIARVKKAWNRQTGNAAAAASAAMAQLREHEERVIAAALMQRSPDTVAGAESAIRYMDRLLAQAAEGKGEKSAVAASFDMAEDALALLFHGSEETDNEPAVAIPIVGIPAVWTFWIGAFIVATLAYSAWHRRMREPYIVVARQEEGKPQPIYAKERPRSEKRRKRITPP
ncbi:sporulation protein YpjB [Paenibacillus sp. 32O-W]|uniref:sporulation protein YpjB n=1 Tax=Paenibacillus sp. 32O-W TaxID=1695218 RepID=UPI00071F681F|nr:sporulation protein YpjB [Paenibacillus sp. 32O-W]ALS27792.1 sporulation protein YpjB [Paenibacillus sp. 32O-W]